MNRADLVVGARGRARHLGRDIPRGIGRSGVKPAALKREGDGSTPAGIWRIVAVYYRPDRLKAPCKGALKILPWMRWSDDIADPAYNCLRRANGFSSEAMRRPDPLYDVVCVLDHNAAPVVACMGSAIFIHIWRGPRRATAGCVAFRKVDLLRILKRWSPRARAIIRL